MRYERCGWVMSLVLVVLLVSPAVRAQEKLRFDIPEQNASAAIQAWARQSGLQVFAADEDLQGVRTNAVRGEYTPVEAAQLLIQGTGLEVVAAGDKTVTIRRPNGSAEPANNDESAAARSADELGEVLVTGTRIKRAGFDTLQAAVVTDAEEFERRGYLNVGQALEATPGFAAGVNGTGGQSTFGPAQTFVNFFGLGTNRTLTLVNGRRFVSSNTVAGGNAATPGGAGQQVDMNVIPAGLIQRVETIAIGGAPVYGADAIAGTVNVILRDDFEGIQTTAQYGVDNHDSAETKAFRALMGGNFDADRGNAILSLEYNEGEGLLRSDRFPFYRSQPNTGVDTGPSDGIPAVRIIENYGFAGITEGGLPFITAQLAPGITLVNPMGNYIFDTNGTPLQFGRNGDLVPLNRGTPINSVLGAPIDVAGGDRLDPAAHGSLVAPSRRTLFNGIAHYEVGDLGRVFIEAAYADTQGVELSELASFASPLLTGTAVSLSINNAFLTPAARNTLIANSVGPTFSVARNFSDIIDRRPSESELELQRLVGGFEGEFDAFGSLYNWDVSYNYGRSRSVSKQAYINNTRFLEAINAVTDAGQIVCASGNVACRPLNLFGQGAASDAAVDYVLDRGVAISTNTQKVANANLTGNLPFGLAAPIAFNLGFEYRREEGSFLVDGTLGAGSSLLGLQLIGGYVGTQGDYFTREAYTEMVIPVIDDQSGIAGIKNFNLEGAVRYVDNSLTGADTTWSAGLKFAPRLPGAGDGLMFRGVFTHAIRAPAITELFSGQTPTQITLNDPCSPQNFNQGPNPQVRADNCAAALAAVNAPAPGTFDPTTDNLAVRGFSVGNPNLQNETADSWSAGIVYQPVTLPRLRVAADWIDIELKQGISSLPIGTLLTQCYDNVGLSNPACAAFERLTPAEAAASLVPRVAGDVANGFRSGFFNTTVREFSGAILAAEYSFDIADAQSLRTSTKVFYTDNDETIAFAGQQPTDAAGLVGTPKYRAQLNLGYSWRWLDLDWQTLWTDSVLPARDLTIEDSPILKFDAYTQHNITLGTRLGDNVRVQAGVNNVLDEQPTYEAQVAGAFRQYDVLGRYFFTSVRASF